MSENQTLNEQLSNIDTLKDHMKAEIREDEGTKLNSDGLHIVYPGPKTGKPHCCYGHLLGQQQSEEELEAMGLKDEPEDWFKANLAFSDEVAERLLEIDIFDAIEGLHPSKRYQGFTEEELDELEPQRFIALINMAFQLGGPGVRMKFPSCVQAIKNEDWDRAADEMLWSNGLLKQRHSQWYIDTPDRCQAMADLMRHGKTKEQIEAEIAEMASETEAGTEEHRDVRTEMQRLAYDQQLAKVSNERLAQEVLRRMNKE